MSAFGAGAVLGLGLRAARRAGVFVIPLFVAEALATLLALLPVAIFAAAAYAAGGSLDALATGALVAFVDPAVWVAAIGAVLLASAGGFLLRTPALVLAAGASWAALEGQAPSRGAWRALVLEPERWLAAAAAAIVLRVVALASGLGCVVLGISYFQAHPGVLAALLMTVATSLVVLLPILAAALELGVVRSALGQGGALSSLAGGLTLAFRRREALLPAWALFVAADLAIAIAAGVAGATVGALPATPAVQVLLLGPRAIVWASAALATALVMLARLGSYVALLALDRGAIAPPPPRVRAPPAPEPIVEAVAVAEAVAVEDGSPANDAPPRP